MWIEVAYWEFVGAVSRLIECGLILHRDQLLTDPQGASRSTTSTLYGCPCKFAKIHGWESQTSDRHHIGSHFSISNSPLWLLETAIVTTLNTHRSPTF